MDLARFETHSLRDPRVLRILAGGIEAVDPADIVKNYLAAATLPDHARVFLLGIGKAAEPMTLAAAAFLENFSRALIITKHASLQPMENVTVMVAGHPLPDKRSLAAGAAALNFVSGLNENDLLICLISGGGSALIAAPPAGMLLSDLQALTASLLESGANIEEINILRSRLDRLKAGGLARATKARVLGLILSDVIGDRLEAVASGPTVAASGTNMDPRSILDKYGIRPNHTIASLLSAKSPVYDFASGRIQNVLVGNNRIAAEAARDEAIRQGFRTKVMSTELQGEARFVGQALAKSLRSDLEKSARPFCWIAGGETTVTLKGDGKGGRNQEVALAAVDTLDGLQDIAFVSLATDGDDGPNGRGRRGCHW